MVIHNRKEVLSLAAFTGQCLVLCSTMEIRIIHRVLIGLTLCLSALFQLSSCGSATDVQVSGMPQMPDLETTTESPQREESTMREEPLAQPQTGDIPAYPAPVANDGLLVDYCDRVFHPSIASARLFPQGEMLAPPVLRLNSPEVLELHFDDLDGELRPYRYTLLHCTRDWSLSDLEPFEYLDGFAEQELRNYEFSTATRQKFVSYIQNIPSEELKPLLSGNYLLIVWNDDAPGKPVLTRRLMVLESGVDITVEDFRPAANRYRDTHQGLRFRINTRSFEDSGPADRLGVVVMQNDRWDNAATDWSPQFVRDGELVFDNPGQVFEAGREYRYFSTRSLSYLSERIANIDRSSNPKVIDLVRDDPRSYQRYSYRPDMNGNWFVALDGNENSGDRDEREADYALVRFSLNYPAPLIDSEMGITGSFTDGRCLPMSYDFDRNLYQAEILLKQGRYDYQYCGCGNNGKVTDLSFVEGNWFEAENHYSVLTYYRDREQNYDRLVGYKRINTRE